MFAITLLTHAVVRLELTASAGESIFPGGEPEATCKACVAVMEHVTHELSRPLRHADDSADARRIRLAHIHSVLDPRSCGSAMAQYELNVIKLRRAPSPRAATELSELGVFRRVGQASGVTAQTSLASDWPRHELPLFCEWLFDEYEEELAALLMTEGELDGTATNNNNNVSSLGDTVCKKKLTLCMPVRKPRGPPTTYAERQAAHREQAKLMFRNIDANRDGHLSRNEMRRMMEGSDPHHRAADRAGGGGGSGSSGGRHDEQHAAADELFRMLDMNGDDTVTMREYMLHSLPPKGSQYDEYGGDTAASRGHGGLPRFLPAPNTWGFVSCVAMGLCVYVGGQVFRFW